MTTFVALLFVLLVGSLIGYYYQPIKQKIGEISTYGLSSLFVAPNSEPVVTAVLLPTPSTVPTTTPLASPSSVLATGQGTSPSPVTSSNSLPQTGPGETMFMIGLAIMVVLTYLILMRERRINLQKAWRSISVAD